MSARRRSLSAAAWAAFLLLSGCSSLNPFASSEPKRAPLPELVTPLTAPVRFTASVSNGDRRYLTPAPITDGLVVAGGNGEVTLFDAKGERRWQVEIGAPILAGVGSDGRLAAVVTEKGEVVALNVSDGSVRWRQMAALPAVTPPLVAEGLVVVRAVDHRLVAFDGFDGKERWRYERPLPPLSLRQSAPLLAEGGAIFVGYPGGVVAALDPKRGQPFFELTVAPPKGTTEIERLTDIVGTILVDRNELCAAAYQVRIACFDLQSGREVVSSPVSTRGGIDRALRSIITVDETDRVLALDLFSGRERWQNDRLAYRQLTRPVVVGDMALVGDSEGYLHAIDLGEGRVRARVRVGSGPIVVPPQRLPDGAVVVQNRDGTVAVVEGVR